MQLSHPQDDAIASMRSLTVQLKEMEEDRDRTESRLQMLQRFPGEAEEGEHHFTGMLERPPPKENLVRSRALGSNTHSTVMLVGYLVFLLQPKPLGIPVLTSE